MPLSQKQKNILIWVLAFGTFSITNTEMGIMGILPNIAHQYHVSIATAGQLVSLFALIIAISGPFLPALLGRFNKKRVMLLAISLFVISCFASAFITNFTWLLIVRVVPAFLHPVFVSYAMSTATIIADDSKQASQYVAKVFMGVSAGMVLGVPLANLLASYGSFRLVMLTFGLINLLILFASAYYLVPVTVPQKLNFKQQMLTLIKLPTLVSLVIIICLNGGVFGFYSYLSDFLSQASSLSGWLISLLLLIYGLTNVLGNEIAGKLLTVKPRQVLVGLPLLMLVPYLLLYFYHQKISIIVILIILLGTLAGMEANLNQYIMNNALQQTPDLANGLFITGANLGTTLGSAACGQIIVTQGVTGSLLGTELFLLGGIVIIVLQQLHLHKHSTVNR